MVQVPDRWDEVLTDVCVPPDWDGEGVRVVKVEAADTRIFIGRVATGRRFLAALQEAEVTPETGSLLASAVHAIQGDSNNLIGNSMLDADCVVEDLETHPQPGVVFRIVDPNYVRGR